MGETCWSFYHRAVGSRSAMLRRGGHGIRREEDRKEEKRTGESVRGKVHV